jgi:hypothetical protein
MPNRVSLFSLVLAPFKHAPVSCRFWATSTHTRAPFLPAFLPLFLFPSSSCTCDSERETTRDRGEERERERERERENRPRGWDSPGEKKRKRPVVITYEFVPGRFLIFDSWLIYVGFCENLWVEICCRRWMGVLDFLFNRIGIAGFLGILF